MVFTARVKETEQRITAFDFSSRFEVLSKYPKGSLISPFPDCDVPVSPRQRHGSRLHFAHWRSQEINTEYEHQPESAAHHAGKIALLLDASKSITREYTAAVEVPITTERIKRIADVAVLDPSGNVIEVYECQLSKISLPDLQKRVDDYEAEGIESYWYFGKSSLTDSIVEYCFDRFGDVRTLEIRSTENYKNITCGR